jgi:hypothetical protein
MLFGLIQTIDVNAKYSTIVEGWHLGTQSGML